jgi:hypothetical protein
VSPGVCIVFKRPIWQSTWSSGERVQCRFPRPHFFPQSWAPVVLVEEHYKSNKGWGGISGRSHKWNPFLLSFLPQTPTRPWAKSGFQWTERTDPCPSYYLLQYRYFLINLPLKADLGIHSFELCSTSRQTTKASYYNGISMSGISWSGRNPISGKFPVRSDLFHRQHVQRLVESFCKRELCTCIISSPLIKIRLYAPCLFWFANRNYDLCVLLSFRLCWHRKHPNSMRIWVRGSKLGKSVTTAYRQGCG